MSAAQPTTKRIVVGVDLSPASREALAWGQLLAHEVDAEVVLVHACGLLEARGGDILPTASARAQIAAGLERDWCAPLRQAGVRYRSQITDGSPIDVLRAAVDVEQPDLLMLGRHSSHRTAALALGSTSLHVLENTRVPTLVVPGVESAAWHRPGQRRRWRLLVGVDGSAPSLRALEVAADLAELFDGEIVTAAAVLDTPVFPLGPATAETCEGEEEGPIRATTMLAAACEPLHRRSLRVQTACRRGSPQRVLLDLAASFDPDIVVVGSRGVGAPGDPLLGSVSRHVVHETGLPVLVVPAAWSGRLFHAARDRPPAREGSHR